MLSNPIGLSASAESSLCYTGTADRRQKVH
uniref:Uncharacterized protein n=1 Tax=Anopheles minimus TaxID=112268 RepID=A0A182WNG8_9DIPT